MEPVKPITNIFNENILTTLVEAISKMDCDALHLILDDKWYYDYTSKSIYIQKLSDVFVEFKKEDDYLIYQKGNCNSSECNNFNKSGFSFIGNKSGRYINFIIDLKENGAIKNIHNCICFIMNENVVTDKIKQLKISIYFDEYLNFKPSDLYIAMKNDSITALNELKHFQNSEISKKELINWYEKYKILSKSITGKDLNYKYQILFWNCFMGITEIYYYIKKERSITIAIDTFKSIDVKSDSELVKWYKKYNDLFHKFRYILPIINSQVECSEYGKIDICKDFPVYFRLNYLKESYELQEIFHSFFQEKVKWYK
jgi:hypothetical protein